MILLLSRQPKDLFQPIKYDLGGGRLKQISVLCNTSILCRMNSSPIYVNAQLHKTPQWVRRQYRPTSVEDVADVLVSTDRLSSYTGKPKACPLQYVAGARTIVRHVSKPSPDTMPAGWPVPECYCVTLDRICSERPQVSFMPQNGILLN
jgi:hypothetical protein